MIKRTVIRNGCNIKQCG